MDDPRCPECGSAMQRLDGGPMRKGWWCYPCAEREAIVRESEP